MIAMLFYEYIANKFMPWINTSNLKLLVILFLDGHVSHLTQSLSEFCHAHHNSIDNGFKICGLHPFSVEEIDFKSFYSI
ncbi:hypothetical protein ALC57_04959 [Trachymyrmex cornetzi]|uniref:DDE-1 domain-containing protein n=1 Tax=Trachymyrmex cornetzi TaxID=471704 RepID=A0A151JBV9_9HYME|nr:hypothetical protein ALC57_04959 [Trachymyrmex cornetzi]